MGKLETMKEENGGKWELKNPKASGIDTGI